MFTCFVFQTSMFVCFNADEITYINDLFSKTPRVAIKFIKFSKRR